MHVNRVAGGGWVRYIGSLQNIANGGEWKFNNISISSIINLNEGDQVKASLRAYPLNGGGTTTWQIVCGNGVVQGFPKINRFNIYTID